MSNENSRLVEDKTDLEEFNLYVSNKSGWIPWNEREDLKEFNLFISYDFYGKRDDIIVLNKKIPISNVHEIEQRITKYLSSYYLNWGSVIIDKIALVQFKGESSNFFKDDVHLKEYRSIIDEVEQIEKGRFLKRIGDWVPWNNREDLENVYLLITTELESEIPVDYLETIGALGISEGAPCFCRTSAIFNLGKIPNKYFDDLSEGTLGNFGLYFYGLKTWFEVLTESKISKTQKRVADKYKCYCEKNGYDNDSCYRTILEIVRDYENDDLVSYYRNFILEETTSVQNASDSPTIEPVASVERPIGQKENYSSTWIYAKGDEQSQKSDDNETAKIGLLASILNAIGVGNERLNKLIELHQQNPNYAASTPVSNVPALTDDSSPDQASNPNDPQTRDQYYLSIKDHYERSRKMKADGYSWDQIADWEIMFHEELDADPLNPLGTSSGEAIRKRKSKNKKNPE